ncbi:dihydrofolate reductase family protein [Pedobacter rhodius]|uniref:Dihydrofolate reductase family protein n=1 Tax=Pedobacter rhodius TaxID=3004098 RepID=A0ABT4L2J3_9SPHI|nr:dihydrofolate reductase family protein [Pedobacter sp. SJ11]MCZ4225409.1 dihydrofolate reductase family protein [Pedobacter sp. SJ11]
MRKLVAYLNITNNGFVAASDGNLDWHLRYWNSDLLEHLIDRLARTDTILLGKNTYVAFSAYWPVLTSKLNVSKEDLLLAEILNAAKKVVKSNTLSENNWFNTSFLYGDLQEEILKLKNSEGEEIIILGSSSLVSGLNRLDLIDCYDFLIHPVAIESGITIFNPQDKLENFEMSGFKQLSVGLINANLTRKATSWSKDIKNF